MHSQITQAMIEGGQTIENCFAFQGEGKYITLFGIPDMKPAGSSSQGMSVLTVFCTVHSPRLSYKPTRHSISSSPQWGRRLHHHRHCSQGASPPLGTQVNPALVVCQSLQTETLQVQKSLLQIPFSSSSSIRGEKKSSLEKKTHFCKNNIKRGKERY